MRTLHQLIPDLSTVTELSTADLAGYVFHSLMSIRDDERGGWHPHNFLMEVRREYGTPQKSAPREVLVAVAAAWNWLETNGLICRDPDRDGLYCPTPRGAGARDRLGVNKIISGEQLPEHFLHPTLLEHARPMFLQSRFENAVFDAFKTLEVAIRTAAGLGHDAIGTHLASKAFHPDSGPLTDKSLEPGERVALMKLMEGAIGSYKNPSSHRRVEITADEARDMIMLASHLLKIVDARAELRKVSAAVSL
jgi:uncharacterized protein (TIGR02391 family)